eukprot:5954219-Amphidinium_carterae.1
MPRAPFQKSICLQCDGKVIGFTVSAFGGRPGMVNGATGAFAAIIGRGRGCLLLMWLACGCCSRNWKQWRGSRTPVSIGDVGWRIHDTGVLAEVVPLHHNVQNLA